MSEKLRFDEAFNRKMKNIPLPDEEVSWQKMNKLLDDNDKTKPFVFFRNYIWFGVFAVVLLVVGGYFLQIPKSVSKDKIIAVSPMSTVENKGSKPTFEKEKLNPNKHFQKKKETIDNVDIEQQNLANNKKKIEPSNIHNNSVQQQTKDLLNSKNNIIEPGKNRVAFSLKTTRDQTLTKAKRKINIASNVVDNSLLVDKNVSKKRKQKEIYKNDLEEIKVSEIKAAIAAFNSNATPIPDSLTAIHKTSINREDETNMLANEVKQNDSSGKIKNVENKLTNSNSKKKVKEKSKKYFIAAGIGLHQQIPVGGQKLVASGYSGNNGLSDYIPSVYLRFERDQQWYIQGEFNYGAPQYVNSFSFFKQTKADDRQNIISSSYLLQKTFYNQIPITFNYYLQPNWSVGFGGMYSWFHGAIVEKQINIKNMATQFESNSTQLVPIKGFNDSFLYRSQTYLLLQTDYQWRRFSFGLRYARDMQPYIKYTLPNGAVEDKRNWSLECILRFSLWKSSKF